MEQVIVLNVDYTYINTVSAKKAFLYIELGKVTVEKYCEKAMGTFHGFVQIPLIVRFTKMIRQIFKRKVKWSKPNIIMRDRRTCAYCEITQEELGKRMTVDHIHPKSQGGANSWENCVCSCGSCNHKKGDRSCREAGMFPKIKPTQPTIMEFMRVRSGDGDVGSIISDFFNAD